MRTSKYLFIAAMVASGAAIAQPGGEPPAQDYTFDMTPLVEEVDTNGNGTISMQEWTDAGICDSIFSMLHTSEGEMTVAELTSRMPQQEADQNGDGKLDASEMTWVCNAGPSGDAPPGGAPGGDAGGPPPGGAPGGAPPGGAPAGPPPAQ